jgi:hypothetical protein
MTSAEDAVLLEGGGRTVVHRRGDTVIRDAGFWTPPVHALLRHLEAWAMAGRARSAAWALRNRGALEAALTAGGSLGRPPIPVGRPTPGGSFISSL